MSGDLQSMLLMLKVLLALQAATLPACWWFVRFLWKLERRVYTLELQTGLEDLESVHQLNNS